VLVAEVHLDLGAGCEHSGGEGQAGGAAAAIPAEHGVDLMGSTDADVVGARASKKPRARRGSSSVRDTSTWRIDSSHQ
jgi:hypothetical protein